MRGLVSLVVILTVLLMSVLPVNALTANSLDIYVMPSGDAVVEFEYTLSWIERIIVFLGVTNPGEEIRRAIADNLGKEVIVLQVERIDYRRQDGPYSQSFSNLDDNIIYIPEPKENITSGKGRVLRLGIKQYAFVEKVKTNVKSMARGDPVPGAEIYIEQEERVKGNTIAGDDEFDLFTTPELSFADTEEAFNQLWVARLINMDFSPKVTRIRFPRGDSTKFSNQIRVPPFNYTVRMAATGNRAGFAVGGFSLA